VRVVVQAVGSAGDVYPFVALGRELVARGHEVRLATNGAFRAVAEAAGLGFVETGTVEEYETLIRDPDLWHPRRGPQVVMAALLSRLPEATEQLLAEARDGADVLVGSTLAWPARIAREVLGVPMVVAHLAPSALASSSRPPRLPGTLLSARAPVAWNHLQWLLVDAITDRIVRSGVEAVRARHGLAPIRRVFYGWMNQCDAVLGLFPDWFAPPPPDWPHGMVLAGFPLGDDAGATGTAPGLAEWLAAGPPPVLFTAGSANVHGTRFHAEAVEAARRLGLRALLVTRERSLVPAPLPDHAFHASYVPFGAVLPRCAALVSHGGVGTCAEGLAAGVPQVVRPLAFDQLDNGSRLAALRVGEVVSDRAFRAPRVAAVLRRLLDSSAVTRACASARARLEARDGAARAADVVLRVAGRAPLRVSAAAVR